MTDKERPAIILIAHDAKKPAMIAWAMEHKEALSQFTLYATGTTGARLTEATGLEINLLMSGPMGGDAEAGALIAEGKLAAVFFLIDPLTAQPHEVDVRAVMRLSAVHNVPMAINLGTAEILIASPDALRMPSHDRVFHYKPPVSR